MPTLRHASWICAAALALGGCTEQREIVADRSVIDFGEVYLGTTPSPQTIIWTNLAPTALRVENVALNVVPSPNPAFAFAFVRPPEPDLLRPRHTMAAHVTFTPPGEGRFRATAEPRAGREAVGQEVELRGTGRAQLNRGLLEIGGGNLTMGRPLDFGPVRIGQTERRFFVITSWDDQPVTVTGRTFTNGTFFQIANPKLPVTIPPRGSITVTVEFAPRRSGPHSDAVIIEAAGTAGIRNHAGSALSGVGSE